MRKKLLIIFIILTAIITLYIASIYIGRYEGEINGIFQAKLAQCDKIVIRDGGNTCHGNIDTDEILLTITEPNEIKKFIKSIEFSIFQEEGACSCCGWPGIDFYCGTERIMVTSVQHNKALRTPIAQYDLELSRKTKKFMEGLTRRFEKNRKI
jgi:hypothetical protein